MNALFKIAVCSFPSSNSFLGLLNFTSPPLKLPSKSLMTSFWPKLRTRAPSSSSLTQLSLTQTCSSYCLPLASVILASLTFPPTLLIIPSEDLLHFPLQQSVGIPEHSDISFSVHLRTISSTNANLYQYFRVHPFNSFLDLTTFNAFIKWIIWRGFF